MKNLPFVPDCCDALDPLLLLPELPEGSLLVASLPEGSYLPRLMTEGDPFRAIALLAPAIPSLESLSLTRSRLLPGGLLLLRIPNRRPLPRLLDRILETEGDGQGIPVEEACRLLESSGFLVRRIFGWIALGGFSHSILPLEEQRLLYFLLRFLPSRKRAIARFLCRGLSLKRLAPSYLVLAERSSR